MAPGHGDFDSVQNPFALGNMVNHPPRGMVPNVMPCAFNVQRSFPAHLQPYVPNVLSKKLSVIHRMHPYLMPSLVLVSTRAIEDGDEIFLNYRYNPASADIPSWFHPIDVEENTRRWEPAEEQAALHGHQRRPTTPNADDDAAIAAAAAAAAAAGNMGEKTEKK